MRGAGLSGLAVLALLAGAAGAAPEPSWTVFADCAGAYVANSRVVDPDRPAAMVSQMGDLAGDYARAARTAYRRQMKAGSVAARHAIGARVQATARRLAGESRETAEKLIDACPQTDG